MRFSLSPRMAAWHGALLCSLAFLYVGACSVCGQTFGPGYSSDYIAVGLPGLASLNGQPLSGLVFSPANPNQLIFETSVGVGDISFYSVTIARGTGDHITGYATTPQLFATVADNVPGGGLIYAPNGTLLFTYGNSQNIVGEITAGSSTLTANAVVSGIGTSRITGLALVPSGLTGAGQLLFDSFDSRAFYSSNLSINGNGTYNILNATNVSGANDPGGGIVYVPDGSPDFPDPAIISAEGDGLFAYNVNAAGYPIGSSVQLFFTDNGAFSGAVIDPLTGDLLVTTNNGSGFYDIQGFVAPIQPTNFTASASGNWNDPTLWTPRGFPNGSNNIANLILPATGNSTINLQGGSYTVNQLNIVGTGAGAWTVTNGTLIFDGTSPIFTNQSTATGTSAILGVNIQLNANTNFDTENSGATTQINGTISGTGKLIVTGAGTLILTNSSNNYSGGTLINGGTLQLGTGAASGTIPGDIVDNGLFVIDRSDSYAYNNSISGTGGFEQLGSGTTTLTQANTYSGGTVVTDGTLAAANNQALGTGGVLVAKGGTLQINTNFQLQILALSGAGTVLLQSNSALGVAIPSGMTSTFSGTIEGTGNGPLSLPVFALNGPGTLHLSGNTALSGIVSAFTGNLDLDSSTALSKNTFIAAAAGATVTVDGVNLTTAGLLDVGTTGGSIVLNGGSLTVAMPTGVSSLQNSFNGNISGTGGLTITGVGITQILAGNNTYSGLTNIAAGTLLARSSTALSPASLFSVNGTLDLGGFSNTIQGLQGNGVVTNSGNTVPKPSVEFNRGAPSLAGLTASLGDFSAGAAATQQRATLTVGTQGSSLKTVFSGRIEDGPDATLGLIIAGGDLILTGTNTYSGGTSITGGTLQLGDGGTTGTIRGAIADDSKLVLNYSGTFDFANTVTGKGELEVRGSGSTIVSGENSYTGGTIIDAGTLAVDNPSALGRGDVTLNGGNLTADPQAINVAGNYFQGPNGTLQLQVAGANSGQYDYLNVGGNAVLGGTLQLIDVGGFKPVAGDTLTLVRTGGTVISAFQRILNSSSTGPGPSTIELVYNKNSVILEFLNPSTVPVISKINFPSFAQTPNQLAAADLLDVVQLDPRVVNLVHYFYQHPFTELASDFDQISPESLSAFYEISFSSANLQRLTLEGRMDDIRNGSTGFSSNVQANGASDQKTVADAKTTKNPVEPALQPVPENRWGIWLNGFGDFVSVDSDFNARGYRFTTGGLDLGVDYRVLDNFVLGVMGDYAHSWTDLRPGTIAVNSGRGGLYATYFRSNAGSGTFYLNGGAYGGYNTYDSNRRVLGDTATGSTSGEEWSAFVSGGYDFHFGRLIVGPVASVQYTDVYVSGFSETGSLAPLQIHSNSEESLRSDLGFRASYHWQAGKIVITPYVTAAWEHEFRYSALPVTAGLAAVPGPDVTFTGPVEGQDSAVISAGFSIGWTSAISTYVGYDGQLGRNRYDANGVSGGIRFSF